MAKMRKGKWKNFTDILNTLFQNDVVFTVKTIEAAFALKGTTAPTKASIWSYLKDLRRAGALTMIKEGGTLDTKFHVDFPVCSSIGTIRKRADTGKIFNVADTIRWRKHLLDQKNDT